MANDSTSKLTGITGILSNATLQGDSAYTVAVKNGFVGTEAEWLASLKGDQGDQGIQGPIGPTGPTGATGNGISSIDMGSSGWMSIHTTDGTDYSFYVKGDKGDTGAKGDKGDTGAKGDKGDQGEQGIQGIQGEKGEKGDKGDTGEVTLDEFYKAFPTDTASGAIASFSDGADDIPLKSLVVNIDPIQDLHGYDSPWVGGGRKNLFQTTAQSKTENGVTWTVNADGTITVSGTATGYTDFVVGYARVSSNMGMVTISGISTATNIAWASMTVRDANDNVLYTITAGETTAVCSCDLSQYPEAYSIRVLVKRNNNVATSGTVKIQVEKGSAATDWTPYENICPISGWTEVGVEQSGINVWDEEWELGDISASHGQNISNDATIRTANYIPVKPLAQYYAYGAIDANVRSRFYDIDKNYIGYVQENGMAFRCGTVFTVPQNAYFIRISIQPSYGTTYNHDISINYPSTDHDYHPYQGRSITIDLGQTVYGAKLYPLDGKAVVDRAYFDGGEITWNKAENYNYGNFFTNTSPLSKYFSTTPTVISSAYKSESNDFVSATADCYTWVRSVTSGIRRIYVKDTSKASMTAEEFRTAMTGVQFVYELAEPIEIQLTLHEVNSLLGVNNIWADTGDTACEYRADTKLYVERLTAPDSADMIADANITSGQYFMVGNSLFKATANIANGGQIIVGTNATRVSLAQALNEINA